MARSHQSQPPEAFARFGELLRYLRQQARLTQRELSIAVGYSESHISRLEQGQRPPDAATLRARFLPPLDVADPLLAERLIVLGELARERPERLGATDAAPPPQPSAIAPEPLPADLLATKLFAPQLRHGVLARPQLAARLDEALDLPLTVIAAAAGSGKTTLVAEWYAGVADRRGGPGALGRAWLALDSGDNAVPMLLRDLTAALRQAAPQLGALPAEPTAAPESAPAVTLTPLLNGLAALPHPVVLVLDDAHVLTSPAALAALAFLIDHAPPQLHLVLLTREDPPLPLARLRARRQMLELRSADLRFSREETFAFLRGVMDITIAADAAATLWSATEGWAVGVQLAALAMRNHADRNQLLVALSGTNRYLVDYLAAEVLDRLPAHLRSFLLQTAVLDRMCAPLCDALRGVDAAPGGGPYSQPMLEELERLHLFIVPLDAARRWYRYHHLFADFLRARLHNGATAGAIVTLHARAAGWLDRHGFVEEAITHASAAGDWEHVAALVERESQLFFDLAGLHFQVNADWLASIPEPVRRQRPMLCLIQSWSLRESDPGASATWLDAAEAAVQAQIAGETQRRMLAEIAATRSTSAIMRGDSRTAQQAARRALSLLAPEHRRTRILVLRNLERALFQEGSLAEADRMIREAIRLAREGALTAMLPYLIAFHGYLERACGRIDQAVTICREGLDPARDHGVGAAAERVSVLVILADLLRERNELDAASALVDEALATSGTRLRDVTAFGTLVRARVQAARGDISSALATVSDKAPFRMSELTLRLLPAVQAFEAQLWLRQGDVAAAEVWAQAAADAWHPLHTNTPPLSVYADEHMHIAPIQLALVRASRSAQHGAMSQAHGAIDRLLGHPRTADRPWLLAKLHVLRALALDAEGDAAGARTAIAEAVTIAVPAGYVRLFLDEGPPAAAVLRALTAERGASAYLSALLAAAEFAPLQQP